VDGQAPRPFDVRTVRHLIKLMSRHDLSEIDLHEGDRRIRLRRGSAAAPAVANAPPAAASAAAAAPPPAAKPEKQYHLIKSETPGTFYARPKPDAEAYVTVGSRVVKGKTVVCLIEAMKLFNEITADCDGTIAEVCVEDGRPVEYGTVLFRVDPA
jgi:acetyl-CoA carboxylase biotin carboxyl carrier protein